MELISSKINIPFMKLRAVGLGVSALLIVFSMYVWFQTGTEKYGVDFLGGSEVVVEFEKRVNLAEVRAVLADGGFVGAVVQAFEEGTNDISIRLKAEENSEIGAEVRRLLGGVKDNSFTVLKEDFVGPIVGAQIKKDGLWALFIALAGILIYISVRFEWRFAIGAIVALVHDVIITSGLYVLSGREISVAVLAALLTIVGYSLNDTIIVFDRVRENLGLALKDGQGKKSKRIKGKGNVITLSLSEIINQSVNQTLSRTLLTSVTTLFVVTSLWLLGGGAVADLAFTLVIGVIVGTYSSIFVACPTLLIWTVKSQDAKE